MYINIYLYHTYLTLLGEYVAIFHQPPGTLWNVFRFGRSSPTKTPFRVTSHGVTIVQQDIYIHIYVYSYINLKYIYTYTYSILYTYTYEEIYWAGTHFTFEGPAFAMSSKQTICNMSQFRMTFHASKLGAFGKFLGLGKFNPFPVSSLLWDAEAGNPWDPFSGTPERRMIAQWHRLDHVTWK